MRAARHSAQEETGSKKRVSELLVLSKREAIPSRP